MPWMVCNVLLLHSLALQPLPKPLREFEACVQAGLRDATAVTLEHLNGAREKGVGVLVSSLCIAFAPPPS